MSKRFYYDEFLEEIYDEQIGDYPSNQSICGILNQQSQRIAELEEQLRKSSVKYFIGLVGRENGMDFDRCVKELDLNVILPAWMHNKDFKFYDTKAEAEAKLKELGEKK